MKVLLNSNGSYNNEQIKRTEKSSTLCLQDKINNYLAKISNNLGLCYSALIK